MCVAAFLRSEPQRLHETPDPSFLMAIWTGPESGLAGLLRAGNVGGLGWIVLALLLTFASITLSLRLIRRRA
jgi:hypothetical protein